LSRKGRICLPLLIGTLVLLVFVTAAERARRRQTNDGATQEESGVEQ
jgi:hypothetical protein